MKIVEHFLEHLCALTVFWYCDLFQNWLEPPSFQHYVILVQLLWIVWLHCKVKQDTPINKTEEFVLRKVAFLVRRLEQSSSRPEQEQPSTEPGRVQPSLRLGQVQPSSRPGQLQPSPQPRRLQPSLEPGHRQWGQGRVLLQHLLGGRLRGDRPHRAHRVQRHCSTQDRLPKISAGIYMTF